MIEGQPPRRDVLNEVYAQMARAEADQLWQEMVHGPAASASVTVPLEEVTRQNILNAFRLKAWEVGLAPVPRRVRWLAPAKRAWLWLARDSRTLPCRVARVAVVAQRRLSEQDVADITAARTAGARPPAIGRGRRLREAALLTLAEVAARVTTPAAPVTRSAVGAWENAERIPAGPRALNYGRFLRGLEASQAQDVSAAADIIPAGVKAAC